MIVTPLRLTSPSPLLLMSSFTFPQIDPNTGTIKLGRGVVGANVGIDVGTAVGELVVGAVEGSGIGERVGGMVGTSVGDWTGPGV